MKKSDKLVLIGGGGHCHSVIDSLVSNKEHSWSEIIILDQKLKKGEQILGFKVFGNDDLVENLFKQGFHNAFITLGNLNTTQKRKDLYIKLKNIGYSFPNIIDSTAVVSKNVFFTDGIFIGKKAVINTNVYIGSCAIINSGVIVEHNTFLSDFVNLAPGSIINGAVSILENTFIGSNSSVKNNITIGKNCIVGMGSVVLNDLPDCVTAYGNPCRIIK